MNFFGKLATTAAIAAGSFFAALPAQALELKMGLITPPPHVWTKSAHHFADILKEKSGGELTLAIFPGGQLGKEPEMFQQMQAGLLDMGIMTAALTSLREPTIQGWFTPFLFSSVEDAIKGTETEAAQEMLKRLENQRLVGLGYSFAGMRHILMREGTVSKLDDLDGKKIRIVPFPAMKVWWDETGAVPTPVQLPDIYQALQSGLLDGVDIDLDALVGLKFQDVAKGLTVTSHMAFPALAMISKRRWESLTPEQQTMIREAMAETLEWAKQQQIQAEKDNLSLLESVISVSKLDNAETVFEAANKAFQEDIARHPLIQQFQQQVRSAK